MTKDRLKDLKPYKNHEVLNALNDGSAQFTAIDVDNEHKVAEFLAQIDLIRLLIEKIDELAKEVTEIHKKMFDPMADPKLEHQLDDKTADIKKLAYDVSTKLKKMEQIQGDDDDIDKASVQWRIRESQVFNITRRFRDVMNQYNQESFLHRERCKRKIVRELEITGIKMRDDELEEKLENGFPGTFSISIIADAEKAKRALNEIDARHRDITKLETSIKELHDMFVDLALLVATQGEMIDNIEHNVSKTVAFVGEAKVEVEKAEKARQEAAKKKIIVYIIILVIVVILILLFGAYFTIKKKFVGR